MTLRDIASQVKYGELRSIAVKDDMEALVSYVNLALIALYGRFELKSAEQIIPLKSNVVEYTLNSDLMTITGIYDEDGDEFTLDDEDSIFSILQIDFETIQVPNPETGATISVVYLPAPTWITYIDESSLDTRIPIPPQLLEPLLHYIGYRAHGSMNGDIKAENNTHYMRYEASCKRIKDLGIIRKAVVPAYVNLKEDISSRGSTHRYSDI